MTRDPRDYYPRIEKRARDIERAGTDRIVRCHGCGGHAEELSEVRVPLCIDCLDERATGQGHWGRR